MSLSKWDDRYLKLAAYITIWSTDPSTKVGCIIADEKNRIVSTGINGLPRGIEDNHDRLNVRDIKLKITIHAEVNALLFAARSVEGCTAFVWPLPPCAQCASALIQAGIKRIVSVRSNNTLWARDHKLASEMYYEAGVALDLVEEE